MKNINFMKKWSCVLISVFCIGTGNTSQFVVIKNKKSIKNAVIRVESLFNFIKSIVCSFEQTQQKADKSIGIKKGKFYLLKNEVQNKNNNKKNKNPHKDGCDICFDFQNSKKMIIKNRVLLMIYNNEIYKRSNLSAAPISHIFNQDLDLNEYFEIRSIGKLEKTFFCLHMVPYCAKSSTLTLFFDGDLDDPASTLTFTGWCVEEKDNTTSRVTLLKKDMHINEPQYIPKGTFAVKMLPKHSKTSQKNTGR